MNGKPGDFEDEEATVFGTSPSAGSSSSSTPSDSQRTGTQSHDRFTLRQVLGEGSQGEVCRAFDNHLQREVAIKFPHRSSGDVEAVEMLDEARKTARLNHPNAVTVYECGWWQGRPFICMELVQGISLASLLKEAGRVSVDRWAQYSRQILAALKAAHAVGLYHRDLKPQNVLVARSGELKLTDFGIAHLSKGPKTGTTSLNNVIAGTPMYMAPEQWESKSPDARSDIYAFGCMSYVMLTGKGPFPCKEPMREHLEDKAPALATRVDDMAPSVDALVQRCVAKDPRDRFQSCDDLLLAISQVSQQTATHTAAITSRQETSGGSKKWVFLLFLLAVLGGAGWFFFAHEKGIALKDRALAAMKGEPAETKPSKDTSEPGEDPTKVDGPGDAIPADEAEKARIASLFAIAEDETQTPADRRAALATIRTLVDGGPNWDRASNIGKSIDEATTETTQAEADKMFDGQLQRARRAIADGRLEEAWKELEEADSALAANEALKPRGREYRLIALEFWEAFGDRDASEGRFREAAEAYREAAQNAVQVGNDVKGRSLGRRREISETLGLCEAVVDSEPRYVLLRFDDLGNDAVDWVSARILLAEAELAMNRPKKARRILDEIKANTVSGDELIEKFDRLVKACE